MVDEVVYEWHWEPRRGELRSGVSARCVSDLIPLRSAHPGDSPIQLNSFLLACCSSSYVSATFTSRSH